MNWREMLSEVEAEKVELRLSVRSSRRQLEDFERSTPWQDIRRQLLADLVRLRSELEVLGPDKDVSVAAVLPNMVFLQGQAYVLRLLLDLPKTLLESAEAKNED